MKIFFAQMTFLIVNNCTLRFKMCKIQNFVISFKPWNSLKNNKPSYIYK